ncbi:MAG TPA: hypothetical protein VFM68_00395 [Candidatus Saccharimonadales bacterium]|nr:hypothetical protein [Candidatus Saccharimonadales bacterium]
MATKKASTTRKNNIKTNGNRPVRSKSHKKESGLLQQIAFHRFIAPTVRRAQDLLQRRPHRSFRRTYRRDYVRSLRLPGYWSFTNYVRKTLWTNKKLFIGLVVAYIVVTIAIIGLASEDIYSTLRETISESEAGMFDGAWGEIGKAGLLLVAGVSGSFNEASSDPQVQQGVYATVIALLTWLTTVWLLRAILTGHRPKLRDGLYNAGAPILSTFLVATVIIVQLLPVTLAAFGYGSAVSSGLLEGGVEAMLFWSVAALLTILSLYWITSTMIALVVVTLPGMYPMQALRTAGDLVIGRRVRILLRFLWLGMTVVLSWALIVIPIILLDAWLKTTIPAIESVPLVPSTLLVMGSLTIVWVASYIYLLYRKVVDDDAAPA